MNEMKKGKMVLYLSDMAELFGTTVSGIRRRIIRNQMPPHFKLGGRCAWLPDQVREWIRQEAKRQGAYIEPPPDLNTRESSDLKSKQPEPARRRPGRPRKEESPPCASEKRRKPGRPRKTSVQGPVAKNSVNCATELGAEGRPRKGT